MSTASTSDSAFRLDALQALVTGGASGIGEATSRELVRAGAYVWIADINIEAAKSLAASLGNASAVKMNVTDPDSIDQAASQLPQLDILVNNAGIGHVGSIATTQPDDFDRLMNVNVRSVFLVTSGSCLCCWPARPKARSSTSAQLPA